MWIASGLCRHAAVALGGDLDDRVAHRAVLVRAGQDLQRPLQRFQLALADDDADVLAAAAGDLDPAGAGRHPLVQVGQGPSDPGNVHRLEAVARHAVTPVGSDQAAVSLLRYRWLWIALVLTADLSRS